MGYPQVQWDIGYTIGSYQQHENGHHQIDHLIMNVTPSICQP